jgi:hypothetical protein
MYNNFTAELGIYVTSGQGTKAAVTTATLGSITGQLNFPTLKEDWSLSNNTSNVLFVVSTSTNPKNERFFGWTPNVTSQLTIDAYNPAFRQTHYPSLFWHQLANYVTIDSIDPGGTPQVDGSIFFDSTNNSATTLNVYQPITWLQTSPKAANLTSVLYININPLTAYNTVGAANIYITGPNITYSDITAGSSVYTYVTATSVQRQIWLS